MYSPQLMDHFLHPRHRGALPGATATGSARWDLCGDRLRLFVRVDEGRVAEAAFEAWGCGAAVAAGSAAADWLRGRDVEEARAMTAFELDRALGGVPPAKRHALVMVLEAVAEALGPRPEAAAGAAPRPESSPRKSKRKKED